jgi:hypothetical protein
MNTATVAFSTTPQPEVLYLRDVASPQVSELLARVQLRMIEVPLAATILGSYWGDSEAGLVGNTLYARADTPLQSLLHETAHYICMDKHRRATLQRDAGGDYAEENAVCYLQIMLADHIAGFNRERMFADMDAWGYTFRLGSARAWFEQDADEARVWLLNASLLDAQLQPTWRVRE